MLSKVFFNLFDNAVKYGGSGLTAIRVSARQEDGMLVIAVEDDGIGIADEDRPHLFERGYGKHTGLGLFLSREILAITGIGIREAGVLGQGGRFEICVPAGKFHYTGNG
jgi:signal transduction histidine kinase